MVKFSNVALIQLLIVLFLAIVLEANVIDKCWRSSRNWRTNPTQLARCSVGFAGKMNGNIGKGVTQYKVTNPSDDPLKPKPGTLRYGASMVKGKVWITFKSNMKISLRVPLLISSFTTLDGRGFSVQISGPGCLLIRSVNNVIIHGLEIYGCKPFKVFSVMGPGSKVIKLGGADADAIGVVTAKKVWIDHNTLYNCNDGLIDVTLGSSDITISNNWFKNQDKVMLLGHSDANVQDKGMRVTVVFNRFGPNCNQRMPRVRFGYVHVANNYYQSWIGYAIGGSMSPFVVSESNYFVAARNKKVTWLKPNSGKSQLYSVNDHFENGASFGAQKGGGKTRPNYNRDQAFVVANAKTVKTLTASAGALQNRS